MSLRHAVLGLLTLAPSNGYELTRRFDESLSNAWSASHSQIYPELAKLEEAGLIEVVGEGARGSRTNAATAAGREEIRRWVAETEPNRGQRSETMLRWFLGCLLEPEDRRAYFASELAGLERHHAGMLAKRDELEAAGLRRGFRPVLELGLEMQEVMLAWLRKQSGWTRPPGSSPPGTPPAARSSRATGSPAGARTRSPRRSA
jgi:DNA-binding PadR family transcriptional regulator